MQKYNINKLLNIPNYKVISVEENIENELHVYIESYKNLQGCCSHCGEIFKSSPHMKDIVKVEDLDIVGKRLFLYVLKRSYRCTQDRRIHVEKIPWLKPRARVTNRFAKRINRLTAITTNQEAGWYFGLDDEVVYRIDKAILEEQAREKLEPIPNALHISVDEVSYRKYHRYLTNVIDTVRRVVIWNAKGRKAEILDQYYKGIGPENCSKIESAAMDGARTYISSTTRYAVNALIVYDKFHLVQKLNQTVDAVRKLELRKARADKNQELIDLTNCKSRFILLKKQARLTDKQGEYLAKLYSINEPIYQAMLLKESFLQIYSMGDNLEEISVYLARWFNDAYNSPLEPFRNLANKLGEKMDYILNWFKQKVSSAISEGFNNKIKRLKRMAYGYKDIDYFRLKIHQHCGLLNPRFSS